MTVAFTDADYIDFVYELNVEDVITDVLMIAEAPGSEVLIRGYDGDSIKKYGRRSDRLDKSIINDSAPAYATSKAQITAILDRYKDPYPTVIAVIKSTNDALTVKLLDLEISDLVTLTQVEMELSSVYFIVESIDLDIDDKGNIVATIGFVQARLNEQP